MRVNPVNFHWTILFSLLNSDWVKWVNLSNYLFSVTCFQVKRFSIYIFFYFFWNQWSHCKHMIMLANYKKLWIFWCIYTILHQFLVNFFYFFLSGFILLSSIFTNQQEVLNIICCAKLLEWSEVDFWSEPNCTLCVTPNFTSGF